MAGKIKTRERILKTSLALFNEEGEAQVSTVDIAAALGISPGNLYYHFKGKEAIIEALFDEFEEEIHQVLGAPITRPLALEDNWIFTYIVFEEINDFRFFYYSIASILERCPNLRPRMARLLSLKQKTTGALLSALEKEHFLAFAPGEKERLAERLAMHLTFWLEYSAIKKPGGLDKDLIHDGVYQSLLLIAPYMADDRTAFVELLDEFYRSRTSD